MNSVFDFLTSETFPARESGGAPVPACATPAVTELAAGGGENTLSSGALNEIEPRPASPPAHTFPVTKGESSGAVADAAPNVSTTLCAQENKKHNTTERTTVTQELKNEPPNDTSDISNGLQESKASKDAQTAESGIQSASTSITPIQEINHLQSQPVVAETKTKSSEKSQNASLSAPTATGNDISAILDQMVTFFRKYVVLPMPEQYDLLSLWVAHTYVFELFHFTPYLIVRSPEPECGKSTLLSILKLLTHAPWKVVVPTPAVIYRKIEAHKPTLLLDEYDVFYNDKIKSEANETLRGTLNAGFERGDVIPRCDGPKNELLEFSPYCPKALAGIGRLPETVESRAFIIPIVRLGHDEHVQEYDEETAPEEAKPIAQALKDWAYDARHVLRKSNPARPQELKPRQRNIAKPLLAIADMAGEEWGDKARTALVRICAKEKLISQGQQLLADVRKIMLAGSMDKITTEMLLEYLVRVENANSPWPVLWENDLKNGKTRGPAKKLAGLLSAFDIHPRTLRFSSDVKNGYARADFVQSWDRYLETPKAETAELDLDL